MSFISTLLDLSRVSPLPPPPDAFSALSAWKAGPGPGRNRSWQLTSWGDDAVRLTLSWVFGDGQLGSLDRYVPSVGLRAGPSVAVGHLTAAVLRAFAEWQTAYQSAKPAENPPDSPTPTT